MEEFGCARRTRGGVGGLPASLVFIPEARAYFTFFLTGAFLPYILPCTMMTGSIIGLLVWWAHMRTRRKVGILFRCLIGALFAGGLGALISFLLAYQTYLAYDPIQRSIVGGIPFTMTFTWYGIIAGAVAGLVVGSPPDATRR